MSTLLSAVALGTSLAALAGVGELFRRNNRLGVIMADGKAEVEAGIQEVKSAVGSLAGRVSAVEQALATAQAGDDLTDQVNELHGIAQEANAIAAASPSAIPPTGDTGTTTTDSTPPAA